ncbi:hypothetical protein ABT282_08405 [Streptomyces sp. NPDC000927]|uniref:hypothetical protein n=1 Tax=Streptomyces sp. NPDC000927 TaxID=3154371 RepID=UPI003322974A
MNIDYENIRVPRLARGAITKKLPNADVRLAVSVERSDSKTGVTLIINSELNTQTVREELHRRGYVTYVAKEAGLARHLLVVREEDDVPAQVNPPVITEVEEPSEGILPGLDQLEVEVS